MELIINNDMQYKMPIINYSRHFGSIQEKTMNFMLLVDERIDSFISLLVGIKDLIINHISVINSNNEFVYNFAVENGKIIAIEDKIISNESRIVVITICFDQIEL